MVQYDFDVVYERKNAEKWMELQRKFGASDLIPFWEADMDFRAAQPVIDAVVERAKEGIYGYPSVSPTYKSAVCSWFSHRHGWNIPEEWILHTPMVITAVAIYIREVTRPGDGIILQTPLYYPFYDVIEKTGRKVMRNRLTLTEEGRYEIDFEDLEAKLAAGSRLLVICNPHNPVGRVWTSDELRRMGELCLQYGAKMIADEVHGDFTWGKNRYTPFASLSADFARNCMTLLSPGKTFNLAGTKQAIVLIADEETRERFAGETEVLDIDRNNCFSSVVTEAAYRFGGEWFDQVHVYIEENMEAAERFFAANIPQIKARRPEGTYLMWLDCRGLGMNGRELSRFMVEKAKVGFGEGMWFGPEGEGFERCTTACPRSILMEGMERIRRAVELL